MATAAEEKAAKLKSWTVTKKDGGSKTVKAYRCQQDGSGVRFYNEDGSIKTSYADGQVSSVEEDD